MKKLFHFISLFAGILLCNGNALSPIVSDISYTQRLSADGNRTKLVDIEYVLEGNRTMFVEFFFSSDGGVTFPVVCTAVTGDAGSGVEPSQDLTQLDPNGIPMINFERKQATWDASVDWDQNFTDRGRIMIKATYGDPADRLSGLGRQWFGSGPATPSPTHLVPSRR